MNTSFSVSASSSESPQCKVGRKEFEALECAILACDFNRLDACLPLWPEVERWQQTHGPSTCARRLLHTAARVGHPQILRTLLQYSRKHDRLDGLLNSLDHEQRTPLHVAIASGHEPAVHLFLDFGARIDTIGRSASALWLAVQTLIQHLDPERIQDQHRDLSSVVATSSPSVADTWLQDLQTNGEQQWRNEIHKRIAIVRLLMSYSGPEVWLRKDATTGRNVLDLARQHNFRFILDSPFAAAAANFASTATN